MLEVRRTLQIPARNRDAESPRAIIGKKEPNDVLVFLLMSPDTGNMWRITSSEVSWNTRLSELLQESFELTDAEIEIVQNFTAGLTVEQIAQTRRRSIATVRTQMRSIYSKTSVTSLPELVRLMVGVASRLPTFTTAPSTHQDEDGPYPRENQRQLLKLPDGRKLEYSVFGAPIGYPVLFMHDEICGDGWTNDAVATLRQLNLRVIAPLRPHYGRTDPHLPGINFPMRQTAEDMLCLMDQLGIDRITVLCCILGGIPILYLADTAPERITGVVSISAPMPVRESDLKKINPLTRMALLSVASNRPLFRFLVRVRRAILHRQGPEAFLRKHYSHPADQRILDDPEIFAAIIHGSRAIQGNGVAAFLSDVDTETETSASAAAKLKVPVKFVIGEQDQNGRARRIQAVLDEGADGELIQLPDTANLALFKHPDTILKLVQDFSYRD